MKRQIRLDLFILQIYITFLLCSYYASAKRICIIGAGASGIFVAKMLIDNDVDKQHEIIVFEKTPRVGGLWFDPKGVDIFGVSAVYEDLTTNIPQAYMVYPGRPYPKDVPKHPRHSDVWNYLSELAKPFKEEHIKLNHMVTKVSPIQGNKWKVVVKKLKTETKANPLLLCARKRKMEEEIIFDEVVVAVGLKPLYSIDSSCREKFEGEMIHSRDYRSSETYRDKSVLVIGYEDSGKGIVKSLVKTAAKVTVSCSSDINCEQYPGIKLTRENRVKDFYKDGAIFDDGKNTKKPYDVVIFATGYEEGLFQGFLEGEQFFDKNGNLSPLYQGTVNPHYTTMFFIGVVRHSNFITIRDQASYVTRIINGAEKLPSESAMTAEIERQSEE